jgi:hypothetical protein
MTTTEPITEYCSGNNLRINIIGGEVLELSGIFYTEGDYVKPKKINLLDIHPKINFVSIRTPSIIDIVGGSFDIDIEYFKSVTIVGLKLIIEV